MTPARQRAAERRQLRGRGARLGRADRTALGRWFWEIDRVLLLLVTVLIGIGLIAVAAASPASTQRYSGATLTLPPLYYFYRQLMWIVLSTPVMIGVSMLPKSLARRGALAGCAIFLLMLIAVPLFGFEVNGAQRWILFGPIQVQPSEFLKPLLTVTFAWLLSLRVKDEKLPVSWISAGILLVVAALLMKQPDFGQTVIFCAVWVTLLTLSGAPIKLLGALGALGATGVVCAYLFYSVARIRIDGFLHGKGDTYQTDSAHATLTNGGLIGRGPGAGTMKFRLPEAHTDYIFSVIGEEFGLIACVAIACIYLAIVVRVFVKLLNEEDDFTLLASAGLVCQFGFQAIINMMVNVQLAPSKGMTLPFISYGGSSMLALSIGFGLLLAFTRQNPYLKRSPYVVKWSGR
ncbi:putative peptidoglycan glycosyltransferase FtsW [Sphingomonas naphthae]|uniref:Probable peptidoglycan glycosyltransferase FtsW n=1 Tax=Sphingomonas naphthae TaxID=1813468 RepID=A0ABY7TRE6_9SPHN|nr:putative peptidoglycan glycosyltransferase FtsW [Sphingomonas naphthae]WCT75525.1 putative peptidoglycan glycosyltransferase FtsW [Sphingomonas naphthae]